MIPESERSIDGILCSTLKPQIEQMKNVVWLVAFKDRLCPLSHASCFSLKKKQFRVVSGLCS